MAAFQTPLGIGAARPPKAYEEIKAGVSRAVNSLTVGLGNCTLRHRHQEFLDFLRLLARTYPRQELHLVLDNYGTHKHPAVKRWLARHPRFHLHFTPTSASWMNQVEIWFSLLHRHALRRGVFRNLGSLVTAIHRFMETWNENCRPFAWVKTADQILAKANRQVISAAGH
jgi:hypothetical protein